MCTREHSSRSRRDGIAEIDDRWDGVHRAQRTQRAQCETRVRSLAAVHLDLHPIREHDGRVVDRSDRGATDLASLPDRRGRHSSEIRAERLDLDLQRCGTASVHAGALARPVGEPGRRTLADGDVLEILAFEALADPVERMVVEAPRGFDVRTPRSRAASRNQRQDEQSGAEAMRSHHFAWTAREWCGFSSHE